MLVLAALLQSLFGMPLRGPGLAEVLRGNRQETASDSVIQVREGGVADPVEAFRSRSVHPELSKNGEIE
jgi:hypothetical protein